MDLDIETQPSSTNRTTESFEAASVPISLLRQLHFCPRIVYFHEFMGMQPPEPLWVQQGSKHHDELEGLIKRRKMERFGLENARLQTRKSVESRTWRIHGIADALLESDTEVAPLEFKLGGKRPGRGHLVQLMAYGMASSEMTGKVFKQGFFLFGRKATPIRVANTADNRALFERSVKLLHQILTEGLMPDSSATAHQCGQCEYLNHCNDRDV